MAEHPLAPACQATRADLERYLEQSQHGALKNVYDCYFVPNVMPPRCAACQQLIASHDQPAMMSSPPTLADNGVASAAASAPPAFTPIAFEACSLQLETDDDNPEVDIRDDATPAQIVMIIVIWCLMGVGLLIGLGASSGTDRSVLVGPAVMIIIGLVALSKPRSDAVIVDKASRIVTMRSRRLVMPCCPLYILRLPFHILSGITTATEVDGHISHVTLCFLTSDNGQETRVPLMAGVDDYWAAYLAAWQQYFFALGVPLPYVVEAGGVALAPQVIVVQSSTGEDNKGV